MAAPMAALSTRTRTILIAAGAAVVVIIIAIIIAVSVGAEPAIAPGPTGTAAPASPASPSPTASSTAAAPGDTAGPAAPDPLTGEPVADSVARDATADFGDRVTAAIDGITPFEGEASGVGESSGPAVRVAVSITNGSTATIALDAVTVNAFAGATPASPLGSDPSATPFSGSLAPGATATGAYSFTVAEGDVEGLVVSVGRGDGTPLVVFGR